MTYSFIQHIGFLLFALVVFIACQDPSTDSSQDTEVICGGFLIFDSASSDLKKRIQYGQITVQSFTTEMVLKESVNLANSGYYFFPVDSNEPFILKIEKQIYETTVDLSDEREISNGVKTLLIDIEKSKKNTGNNLNYTIYSPLFLFIMILAILKWDITVVILNDYILYPIQVVLVALGLQKKDIFKYLIYQIL